MGTVYVFFADGFEEIEAFTSVDVMRRAGLNVEMVTVTPDEIVTGAHDVPVLCDKNVVNCDFFDAELVLLPGGMPGASTLEKCGELRNLVLRFAQEQKPIAAICAAPMVLGKLGLLKGKKATCYPGFEQYLDPWIRTLSQSPQPRGCRTELWYPRLWRIWLPSFLRRRWIGI